MPASMSGCSQAQDFMSLRRVVTGDQPGLDWAYQGVRTASPAKIGMIACSVSSIAAADAGSVIQPFPSIHRAVTRPMSPAATSQPRPLARPDR